jgi:hypothetical protein
MNTLALSLAMWDLTVDGNHNIAVLSGANQIAQDVASAIQTYLGEVYYDTTIGIPYVADILAMPYAPAVLKLALQNAALTVPGVVSAKATITAFQNRKISGVVQVIDTTGASFGVTF